MNKKFLYKSEIKTKLKDYFEYLVIGLSLIFLLSLFNNIVRLRKSDDQIDAAKQKVVELKSENSDLKSRAEAVEAERFIEQQIRDNLGLAKEGEIVVVLPDDETLKKLAPSKLEKEVTLPDPNWRKWAKLFL